MYTLKDSLQSTFEVDELRNRLSKAKHNDIKIKAQQENGIELDDGVFVNVVSTKDYLQRINLISSQDCIQICGDEIVIDINYILLLFKRSYYLLDSHDLINSNIYVTKNDFDITVSVSMQNIKTNDIKDNLLINISSFVKQNNDKDVICLIDYESVNDDIISNAREEASTISIKDKNIKIGRGI